MTTLLNEYLASLELGEPKRYENIVVVPVFTRTNGTPNYLTLTEALQQQLAIITEVSPGGQVPNIKIANVSDQLILLIDGEELIGARQNRVLNTSILLAGKSETIIPVSCTEARRWSYKSPAFA